MPTTRVFPVGFLLVALLAALAAYAQEAGQISDEIDALEPSVNTSAGEVEDLEPAVNTFGCWKCIR